MRNIFPLSFSRRRLLVLWGAWWQAVQTLRPACRRLSTFLWLATVLAALCLRPDLAGVTSLVRGLGLVDACYPCLLHFFHSNALPLAELTACWLRAVRGKLFGRRMVRVKGRPVVLVDGLKRPKEGRKMPAVKSLHQESDCNAKAPFIMGHSCQTVALLVQAAGVCLGVPIASRIHEGLVWSNRDRRSLLDKLGHLLMELAWEEPITVVADAYYAAGRFTRRLLDHRHHLITRVRSNAVAFASPPPRRASRGRPRLYGKKLHLRHRFKLKKRFSAAPSPVYDDRNVTLHYATADLLWRPLRQLVRYVWVIHPRRGRLILLSTDLSLTPLEIIQLYGWRFKIETGFKQAIHTIGAYAYHFWMRTMIPIRRGSGNQHLHRKSEPYRRAIKRKFAAYERHIQIGLIAQGLLQYLALTFRCSVWRNFGSYLRTMKPEAPPSEWVVAHALRSTWHDFLRFSPSGLILKQFLLPKLDRRRCKNQELIHLDLAA